MKLDEYLLNVGKTQAAFAREVEESPQNIGRYVNGDRIPEEHVMFKIFEATSGKVTANDFYGLPPKLNGNARKGKYA